MTAQPATTAPPQTRPRPTPRPRPPLQVVAKPAPMGRLPLIITCGLMLLTGLLSVLVLNTALARGAYELSEMSDAAARLSDVQHQFEEKVRKSQAPSELMEFARSRGMRTAEVHAYVNVRDGQIYGSATAVAEEAKPDGALTEETASASDAASSSREKASAAANPQQTEPRSAPTATQSTVSPSATQHQHRKSTASRTAPAPSPSR